MTLIYLFSTKGELGELTTGRRSYHAYNRYRAIVLLESGGEWADKGKDSFRTGENTFHYRPFRACSALTALPALRPP